VGYPTTAARLDLEWKTERAEHRVALDVTRADGTHDKRTLRGAIAVERPDKFRLRALGPGGITLFDLVSVAGRVRVIEAIKDPKASALGAVIQALAGDLQAAYLLEPGARTVENSPGAITVRDAERTVRLSKFVAVGGRAVPLRLDVENRALRYAVGVDVSEVELDVPLDPALFAE
jgi:hypothetical protein